MKRLSIEEIIELARKAREGAYAPYSNFPVGAAIECADGTVLTGCNIENSSYGLTMCAERVAIYRAIAEGRKEFSRLVVIADTHAPVPPCGACRQVIYELCGKDIEILMANLEGRREFHTISELMPDPFDQSFL